MMLSIILFISLITLTFSTKVGQHKGDLENEKNIVITQPVKDGNLRRSTRILAVRADLQLSVNLANLMDVKTLNSIHNYDDYMNLRNKYQNIIKEQRSIISDTSKSIPNMRTKLSNNEAELLSIQYKLDNLLNETNTITEQLDSLQRLRDYEKQDFQEKLKDSRALIIGIERTQESMRDQAVGDQDLNQLAVQHILDLMKNTMESLDATMKHDIKVERQAEKNYKDFKQKSNQLLFQYKNDIETLDNRKALLEPETIELRNKIKTDMFRKGQAEVYLAQAITDLDELDRLYKPRN